MRRHEQVKAELLDRIRKRIYLPGERIAPIREIAREMSVSTLTVARAVEELAKSGYLRTEPSRGCFVAGTEECVAAERQANGSRLVGVLLQIPATARPTVDPMFSDTFLSIQEALIQNRLNVMWLHGLLPQTAPDRYIPVQELANKGLCGLITLGHYSMPYLLSLRSLNLPVVALDVDATALRVDSVCFDNHASAARMVRRLHRMGAERIAFAGGPFVPPQSGDVYYDPCARERLEGWRAGMIGCGLDPLPELIVEADKRGGINLEEKCAELFRNGPRPDAFLTEYPGRIAKVLDEAGIPESACPIAAWTAGLPDPDARRVDVAAHCNFKEVGREGVRLFAERLAGEIQGVQRRLIQPRLVEPVREPTPVTN